MFVQVHQQVLQHLRQHEYDEALSAVRTGVPQLAGWHVTSARVIHQQHAATHMHVHVVALKECPGGEVDVQLQTILEEITALSK